MYGDDTLGSGIGMLFINVCCYNIFFDVARAGGALFRGRRNKK